MSILDLIRRKVRLAAEIAKHHAGMEPSQRWGRVDTETELQRIQMCENDLCGSFNSSERRCNECGCYIDIKAKYLHNPDAKNNALELVQCPKNFW